MMNGFTDSLTSTMETNRSCLRRIARHDEAEFSNQSILNAMDKFVKSVNTMDETILVPCRLMDLKVGDSQDTTDVAMMRKNNGPNPGKPTIKDMLSSADLFDLYNMLNTVKVELLWGQNHGEEHPETTATPKGHVRRPSTVSMASTNSAASVISDSESDTGIENDSGIEIEDAENRDQTQVVAQNFRRHLHGLHKTLKQLTEAANYLTTRYQHDVGSPV